MAGRRASSRTQLRLLAALLLLALVGGGIAWWHLHHWRPDRGAYPVQGVEAGGDEDAVDWRAVKAIGADFAYLDASASAFARDPGFVRNLEEAKAAGLQVGAVHRYDPCQPADRQAGNFVTVVPRDAKLPMSCGPVSESAVSTCTSSIGTPSVSAQICRVTDFMPWPRSMADSETVNLPLGLECTSAWLGSPPRFMPMG